VPTPVSDATYTLLDSGDGRKLEQVGPHRLVRPAPQAVWRPRLKPAEWHQADAEFVRAEGEKGGWRGKPLPERWAVTLPPLTFWIQATGFGHLGLFPEQRESWSWIAERVRALAAALGRPPRVLNLFAYTGGSTLAALRAGAEVTHVDASKGVVQWARDNAAACGLEGAPCRWLVDDVKKFMRRAVDKGLPYDGIVLDPPTFGRGPKGQVWKIEPEAAPLLDACKSLLNPEGGFVLLSCHTPGFTPTTLANLLSGAVGGRGGEVEHGEMLLTEGNGGRALPSGAFARWTG
jgi:23S rRNA (cytosine1962-C5)-methyltransferase